MAEYYATAIVPARVRHPKDKNLTEGSVGYITRQIIARLRDVKFLHWQNSMNVLLKK